MKKFKIAHNRTTSKFLYSKPVWKKKLTREEKIFCHILRKPEQQGQIIGLDSI